MCFPRKARAPLSKLGQERVPLFPSLNRIFIRKILPLPKMSERTLVIDHVKFSYDGLFNAAELYNLISSFFFSKGWDWKEPLNVEQITPYGKQIRIKLEPWKCTSDYYKIILKISLHMTDLKDVEIEQNGQTVRLNQGEIKIIYDGYVVADRSDRWAKSPFYWFLTIIAQRYFFRDQVARQITWLKNDFEDLHDRVKRYLNVYKYATQA